MGKFNSSVLSGKHNTFMSASSAAVPGRDYLKVATRGRHFLALYVKWQRPE